MKVLLTGEPGSGKSTALARTIEILKEKGIKIGGIVTPEVRSKGKRIGFVVKDVYSDTEGILARVDQKVGPKLGKYTIDLESFEKVALPALDFAIKNCEIIVIDEIGKMEFLSEKFKQKILEIFNSDKKVIAVVHKNFVSRFKSFGKVIEVNPKNRDSLPQELAKYFLSGSAQN